jgi:propanol-preferring alcohol dehydrogenase
MVELPMQHPDRGHVRVRVEACGICHSDGAAVEPLMPVEYPRVPGHEVIGRVDAVGDGVEGWNVGDRVGVGWFGGQDNRCAFCRRGDFVNCENQPVTGLDVDGGYAEMLIARETGLVRVPDDMDSVASAPLMCAGLTTFNALRNSPACAGDLVGILGVGGLGHLGVQYARRMGFRVVALARGQETGELARQLGAHYYIDTAGSDPVDELRKLGGPRVILNTTPSPDAVSRVVPGLAPNGSMIVVGAGGEPPQIMATDLIFGRRHVDGWVTGTPADAEDTLAFSSVQDVHSQNEVVGLTEAANGYARMASGKARFRVVIDMSR